MKYSIKKIVEDMIHVFRGDGRVISMIDDTKQDGPALAKEAIRRDKLFPQTKGRKTLFIKEKVKPIVPDGFAS